MRRRVLLIASGGLRLTAELPASAPEDVRVVCTCDPRDQTTREGYRHRRVYFVRQDLADEGLVFVQQDVVDVACETVAEIQ